MTNEQKQVRDWMLAFGQRAPDKPEIPDLETRRLRAKLELEETLEKIVYGFGFPYLVDNVSGCVDLDDLLNKLKTMEFKESMGGFLTKKGEPNLKEIADGSADQKVVIYGSDVACGLVAPYHDSEQEEYDPLFNEVMRSNWSKMWTREELDRTFELDELHEFFNNGGIKQAPDGGDCYVVKDDEGKVIKSPSYSPANLGPIIEEMKR